MKHLKLVVNNKNKKKDIFFNKKELKLILNLYAKMVSDGEWKDYGLSISKKEVSFNVYHRASEFPAYKITKNLKPKNENDVIAMAEKNCTAVSHEIMHELLRQSGYKRYIEDVHDTWQQHLFEAIPFEQYGEDFELTSKKPSFLTLDTTMFEKKS